jgi:2Fe-2S ferredoxin
MTDPATTIDLTFVLPDGTEFPVAGRPGESILAVAHKHNVPLAGACGGGLACSTCHVVLSDDVYTKVEQTCPLSSEEEDLLDCVGRKVTRTSRLGCQVVLGPSLQGARLKIPSPGQPH